MIKKLEGARQMKVDRLVSIIMILLDKKRIGAQELADMFEVSPPHNLPRHRGDQHGGYSCPGGIRGGRRL